MTKMSTEDYILRKINKYIYYSRVPKFTTILIKGQLTLDNIKYININDLITICLSDIIFSLIITAK